MSDCAFLNNSGNFTAFTYNGRTIRFRTPSSLERYTDILEWDKGYLVVMAKYKGAPAEEEYIDLVPILNNLYIDATTHKNQTQQVKLNFNRYFLPIKKKTNQRKTYH